MFLKFKELQLVAHQLYFSGFSSEVQPLSSQRAGPEVQQPEGFRREAAVWSCGDSRLKSGVSHCWFQQHCVTCVLLCMQYIPELDLAKDDGDGCCLCWSLQEIKLDVADSQWDAQRYLPSFCLSAAWLVLIGPHLSATLLSHFYTHWQKYQYISSWFGFCYHLVFIME